MKNKTVVIGISGKAGSGKNSFGEMFAEYGFWQMALADPIKRLVEDVFVLDHHLVHDRILREQPLSEWDGVSVRFLLQKIGTELFRENLFEDVWLRSLIQRIKKAGHDKWVVTDVRFPNEQDGLRKEFGSSFTSVRLLRDGCNGTTQGSIIGHRSEKQDFECDYTIHNNGSLDDLRIKSSEIWAKIQQEQNK